MLEKASTRLAIARRRGVTSAALINMLDEEKTLKNVTEHHHLREETALFKAARELLPDEARAALVHDLAQTDIKLSAEAGQSQTALMIIQ